MSRCGTKLRKLNVNHDKRSYFDTLSNDEIGFVVRLLSVNPLSPRWCASLDAKDIIMLYYVGGALSSFCHSYFDAVSWNPWSSRLSSEQRCLNLSDSFSKSIPNIIFDILYVAGGSFSRLCIGAEYNPKMKTVLVRRKWVDSVAPLCSRVNRLDIVTDTIGTGVYNHIVRLFGRQLATLTTTFTTWQNLSSIRRYCPALRKIEFLAMDARDAGRTRIWNQIGATLEYLAIHCFISVDSTEGAAEVRKIEKHCRRLLYIHIGIESDYGDVLAKCVASYGRQLDYAYLTCMSATDCRVVRQSCPNARFSLYSKRVSSDLLLELSDSLQDASLILDCEHLTGFHIAMSKCSNLRSLHVGRVVLDYARELFAHPLPTLTALAIWGVNHHACDILRLIALCTSGLEELSFKGIVPKIEFFSPVIRRNPLLADVSLMLDMSGEYEDAAFLVDEVEDRLQWAELRIEAIAAVFSKANRLKQLTVADKDGWQFKPTQRMKSSCRVFRFRRVYIEIDGYDVLFYN